MMDVSLKRELGWLDERFLKSLARFRYMCFIERGVDTGYEIIRYVRTHLGIRLSSAAVYPVLQTLESDGYIVGEWVRGCRPNKRRYRITYQGRKTLAAMRKRIYFLVGDIARRSMQAGGRPPRGEGRPRMLLRRFGAHPEGA
jgi:DNA-binding PadR family transcriptional regulator